MAKNKTFSVVFNVSVLVVAMGYFVDIFDLTLFNMLRKSSLMELGIADSAQVDMGLLLLNAQMVGMLMGGVIWGVLGDKKGRMKVLFASILMYSVANLANAFVHDIPSYVVWRFLAGVGLAGELGVGITLVSEILPKDLRGLGTTLVATVGVFGATLAGFLVEHLNWRICYIIGGSLGLALLLLRVSVKESAMFEKLHVSHVTKGSFMKIFTTKNLFIKFIHCVLIGVPIWFIAGILMAFSPEIAPQLGLLEPVTTARTIAISYLGLAVGDFSSGLLSQFLKSRTRVVKYFMLMALLVVVLIYTTSAGKNAEYYYFLCFLVGIAAGYWAIFVTIAAEQFGTNIRATAATTIPNFVRASVVPMSLFLSFLKGSYGIVTASAIVGAVAFSIALYSSFKLRETYHQDLDYVEPI